MQENTPLKYFEAKIGHNLIRLNLIADENSDAAQYTKGLGVYIQNHEEKYCFEDTFTIDRLPKQAFTIFFDVQTLFEYIIDNHNDSKRVKITEEGLLVCNIIKIGSTQRRQEVLLTMTRVPLEKQKIEECKDETISKEEINQSFLEMKAQNKKLENLCQQLKEELQQAKKQISSQNIKLKELEETLKEEKEIANEQFLKLNTRLEVLEKEEQKRNSQMLQHYKQVSEEIKKLRYDLSRANQERQELNQGFKKLKVNKKQSIKAQVYDGNVLGEKVQISIDKQNENLKMFSINGSKVQKIDGDQTRFQLLGNQILGKASQSYFEIKIVKLTNENILIGLASLSRRGQRHSHNHFECVCLDGSGKIFEMGKKYPSLAKLQSGQTLKVLLDLECSMVRWLIGFTEIASVQLPDNLMYSKLVPYIELNEVGDIILLNG